MSKAQTQTTNAIAKKQTSSIATLDVTQLENLAGLGVENVGQRDLALPFLKILSQLSPQVTAGDSRFIEEAKAGPASGASNDCTTTFSPPPFFHPNLRSQNLWLLNEG